jgi:hypothetical protein
MCDGSRGVRLHQAEATNMHRHRTVPLVLVSSLLAIACDVARSEASAKSAENTAPAAPKVKAEPKKRAAPAEPAKKAEEPASKTPVLEETELPGLGKLKMPKGHTSTADKHWSFDLGNYESINVSWEPHGAPNLKKAESLSGILANAETVKSSTTLGSGYHEIERVRAADGFTFIVVFGPDWYVKCVAPAAHMETCREIVRSKK